MFGIKDCSKVTFVKTSTGEKVFESSGISKIATISYEPSTTLHIDKDNKYKFNMVGAEIRGTLDVDPQALEKIIYPKDNVFKMEINGLAEQRVQARKHKKKRINKKWLKRYGYKTIKVPFKQTYNKCKINYDGEPEILADNSGEIFSFEIVNGK